MGVSIATQRAKERENRTPDSYGQNGETGKAEMRGAGHPGLGPDFRDLMSRTLHNFSLLEPDVHLGARMSGLWPGCPAR